MNLEKNLKSKFELKNIFEVPKIEKIVVNIGVGEATVDSKKINSAFRRFNSNNRSKTSNNPSKKIYSRF